MNKLPDHDRTCFAKKGNLIRALFAQLFNDQHGSLDTAGTGRDDDRRGGILKMPPSTSSA